MSVVTFVHLVMSQLFCIYLQQALVFCVSFSTSVFIRDVRHFTERTYV